MRSYSRVSLKRIGQKFYKKSYLFFLLIISIFILWREGEAATITAINGTVADGQNITVTGANLGNSGPNVVIFDDFESGTPGANISTGVGSAKYGQWDARDASGSSYYGTSASVSGSQSFSSNYSVHYSNWIQANLPDNTRNVFISWWLYLPSDNNYPGEPSAINWKQMWLQGSSTVDDDLVLPTRLPSDWLINGNDQDPGYYNYTNTGFVKGQWKRQWIWLKGSTSSTSLDGEVKFWTLGAGGVTQQENAIGVNNIKATGEWERVRPNGFGNTASNCVTSFDDIYIASGPNAMARLEIGNAPIYNNSTKLTILTPTVWSDNSITATVNTGAFGYGDVAYLFVIDAGGNVSAGYPITIGGGAANIAPVDAGPAVAITSPTTASTYSIESSANEEQVVISGTASDDIQVAKVIWSDSNGGSGNATDTSLSGDWSTWELPPVTVTKAETVAITVTAQDSAGQSQSKTISITCTSPTAWSAVIQTGDPLFKNSGVTYCVRLLVQGASITESASQIVLGMQGRSLGDYTFKKLTIAERDSNSSEGNVVDSTWTKVTFGGVDWASSVTVPAGGEKLSDPIPFALQAGKDYYVTFKIDTPSVYLNPPVGYRELYFTTADHTDDIDWSGNGYSATQDYHALSKIYIYSGAIRISPPEGFQKK